MEKLPSFADFQRTQTELELKSITEQKLSNQVEEIRHELEMKCTELSNSQRDILKLKMQVCIKMMYHFLRISETQFCILKFFKSYIKMEVLNGSFTIYVVYRREKGPMSDVSDAYSTIKVNCLQGVRF